MIQTTRYERFDLIVHRGRGSVSAAEILQGVEESHARQALPLEIWDFSEAEVDALRMNDLGALLGQVFGIGPPEEGEKTAFIVPKEKDHEMALLFKRMAEFHDFPVELRLFSDLQPATSWLFGPEWGAVMEELAPSEGEPDSHPL
jgi:hypothetical protein